MDERIKLAAAAKILGVSYSTVWKWATSGFKARDGSLHVLEHRWIGARIHTTRKWVDEFCDAVDAANKRGRPSRDEVITKALAMYDVTEEQLRSVGL